MHNADTTFQPLVFTEDFPHNSVSKGSLLSTNTDPDVVVCLVKVILSACKVSLTRPTPNPSPQKQNIFLNP